MNTTRTAPLVLGFFCCVWLDLATAAPAQGLLEDVGNTVSGVTETVTETVEQGSQTINQTVEGALGTVEQTLEETLGGGAQGSASTSEQEFALQAVRSGRALPLEDMLFLARLSYEGEVIDVHLVTARGILLYQLTFLATDGEIFDTYFYAANGNPVRKSN